MAREKEDLQVFTLTPSEEISGFHCR